MKKSVNQYLHITNMHEDHIASCLCCRNFNGDLGTGDLSDVTPGSDARLYCNEGEFEYGKDSDMMDFLADVHDRARHCKLFQPRPKGEPNG